jgi:orotate phosphoribosyltransferase
MSADDQVLNDLRRTGALLEGHFILTSGRHSGHYIQCALLLQHPAIAERLTAEIGDRFHQARVATVAAPAVGGIVVAQGVARALGARAIFSERQEGRMTFRRGFSVDRGERVLVVEDVVTTGGSVGEVIDLVGALGAEVVGVGMIVDRSSREIDFGVPTQSLLRLAVETWDPADCPLCRQGGAAVKPGSRGLA